MLVMCAKVFLALIKYCKKQNIGRRKRARVSSFNSFSGIGGDFEFILNPF